MKQFVLVFCLILCSLTAFAEEVKKVAVLEVVDRQGDLSYNQKFVLRSSLAKAITNTPGFEAYDRSDVDIIMSEQNFQRTGMVSSEEIRRLGEMTGVSLILVTEGIFTSDKRTIYVSAKILNVETGKVEKMDNTTMGTDIAGIEKGCTQLANRLFVAETPKEQTTTNSPVVKRLSPNKYSLNGEIMNKREFRYFLENNCEAAYRQYRKGQQMTGWGAGLFVVGSGLFVSGFAFAAVNCDNEIADLVDSESLSENRDGCAAYLSMIVIGSGMLAASIPLMAVGVKKKKTAYLTYNKQCSTNNVVTLNLQTSRNGIGLSLNF
ncbi:MAG: hypothetical protein IJ756_09140 [Paludibacteraceae bacterium]|nr:hypothetical protein [Paludibacteraceae bacterium]